MQQNFWKGRKVLVTGAGGFTGSHLANALAKLGANVRAFVRAGGSTRKLKDEVEIFFGDLREAQDCEKAVAGVDTVFNVAAVFRQVGGGRPILHAVHVQATEHLMRAAKKAGVRRFVHTSTMGVHGHVKDGPGDECTEYGAGDDYQDTKLEGELLARKLAPQLGLPLTVIRPCAIYGPEDTRFLKMIKPIRKGSFIMIGSGDVHCHFVYVDDLVRGFILAAEKPEAEGEVFLVGGDDKPTLNELALLLARLQGVSPPPRIKVPVAPVYCVSWICEKLCNLVGLEPPLHPRRVAFFTKNRDFSIEKAKSMLGFQPSVPLEEGMQRTIKWSEKNGYLASVLICVQDALMRVEPYLLMA